jgi:hypothetical protein
VNRRGLLLCGLNFGLIANSQRVFGAGLARTPPAHCRLEIEPTTIRLSGSFTLIALLQGEQSCSKFYFPIGWGFRGFRLTVIDRAGNITAPRFYPPSGALPPESLGDPMNYVSCFDGSLIGQSIMLRATDCFYAPGSYSVKLEYVSPVPRDLSPRGGAVVTEDGPIQSAPVEVVILP